jgi:nitrite reductase (NADH) large subunit
MKNVVIIGASLSGHSVAASLRENCLDCSITLISEENYPAYKRLMLVSYLLGEIKEEQFPVCQELFYLNNKINFIRARKIASLNTEKRLAYFKDKGSIDYDFLVIATGRSVVVPEIPGAKKDGCLKLYNLDDIKELSKRFISQPVCIVGSSNFAFEMAKAVHDKFKVDVKLIMSDSFISYNEGLEIIRGELAEVIGEGEVQAVKLKEGKAIGVGTVLFMEDKPNLELIKNTRIEAENGIIKVDENMRTSVENIYAFGSVAGNNTNITGLISDLVKQMKGEKCPTS